MSKIYTKEEKNRSTFANDAVGNLEQAVGSLRIWRERPLEGSNGWYTFRVPWEKDTRVVVLSIVKTGHESFSKTIGNTFVEINEEWADAQGIALCATVPQFFIEHLAGMGGSTLDLLLILCNIRRAHSLGGERIIHEDRSIEILCRYREDALRARDDLNLVDHGLLPFDASLNAETDVITLTLAQLRHRPTKTRGDEALVATSANIGASYGILSDMHLGEIYCLAKLIVSCNSMMRILNQPVCRNVELARYDCRICSVPSVKHDGFCQEDFKVWSSPRKLGTYRPGLYFRHIQESGELVCWPVNRFGPSFTELMLNIRSEHLPASS